jgi:hypothetical protein
MNEWRFRKNTHAVERQSFLCNGSLSPNLSPYSTVGIKVTNTKIERWKRNSKKEAIGADGGSHSNPAIGGKSLL